MWSRFLSRSRRAVRLPLASRKLKLEQLEDRLTPSAFAASVGGLLADSGQGVGTDVQGNVYVAGNRGGTLTDIDTDGYIGKYMADGTPLWSKVLSGHDTLGNSFGDSVNAIAVDAAGNSYVAGSFRATLDFGNGIVLTSTGAIDGFVAKYDTLGSIQWVHQFASNGNFGPNLYDRLGTRAPKGIAVDGGGNVVVTGYFHGHTDMDYLAHPGLHFLDTTNAPNDNGGGYVVKLDRNGNYLWEAQAVGDSGTTAFAVALDAKGDVYTVGNFGGRAWFNDKTANNSNQPNLQSLPVYDGSNRDVVYVWKLTANGLNARVTQVETALDNTGIFGLGIAVDAANNTYVTGAFRGTGFDFDPGVSQPGDTIDSAGGYDAFIAKLDKFGHFQWVRRAGGVADDWGTGIALDGNGNPYITGYVSGNAMFGNQLLMPVSPLGNSFVAELTPAGSFLCTQKSADLSAAAPAGDRAAAVAVDRQGFVNFTGAFDRRMQWPGLSSLNSAGSSDIFTIKVRLTCSPIVANVVDGHILRVTGTNDANFIGIVDNGQGSIQVTLDQDAPRLYPDHNNSSGIDQIEVITFGGTDTAIYDLVPAVRPGEPPPAIRPADLLFDLGSDDDLLTIHAGIAATIEQGAGIWHLNANTGNGDDQLFVTFGGTLPTALTADLGRGNDFLSATLGDIVDTEVRFNFVTGDGNDICQITHAGGFGGSGRFFLNLDMGRGDDSGRFDAPDLPARMLPPTTPMARGEATINLGDGADDWVSRWASGPAVAHSEVVRGGLGNDRIVSDWQYIDAALTLLIDGEGDNDDIRVTSGFILEDSAPNPGAPTVTVNLKGGAGDDRLLNQWLFRAEPGTPNDTPLRFNSPLISNLDGGTGTNDLADIYAYSGITTFPGLILNAPIATNLASGGNDSTARVDFFRSLPSDQLPTGWLQVNSVLTFNLLGAAGRDFLELNLGSSELGGIKPLLLAGSSVTANLDGGAGNDFIVAILHLDPSSTGRVSARVLGRAGNDDLTLNIFGIVNQDLLDALIDGGAGFDTAHHTANVRATNCER